MQCRSVGSDWEGLATRCRREMPPRDATTWRGRGRGGRGRGEREREREERGHNNGKFRPAPNSTTADMYIGTYLLPLGVGGGRRWYLLGGSGRMYHSSARPCSHPPNNGRPDLMSRDTSPCRSTLSLPLSTCWRRVMCGDLDD